MTSNDLPVYAIAAFGLLFIGLAILWPWLSWQIGISDPKPGQRLMAGVLGMCLLGVWSLWFFATRG